MRFLLPKVLRLGITSVLLLGTGFLATASITLDLNNATTYAQAGITAVRTGSSGNFIANNELIGIYGFKATEQGVVVDPFWSICLSPQGTVDWNEHTYDKLSFAQANPGLNPSAWAHSSDNSELWGIQNANYLWRKFSADILAVDALDARDKGTALALAMYEALYDSVAYGYNLSGGTFAVTGGWGNGSAGTIKGYYDTYIASLMGFSTSQDIYDGYVLKGNPLVDGKNGQEFILIGAPIAPTDEGGGGMVVPEPTTMIAGALLLLPFAASALRRRRANTETSPCPKADESGPAVG